MTKETAYLVGTNPYSYRRGEPAVITGVFLCKPKNYDIRPCYEIKFKDGKVDYVAIHDYENYKIISESELPNYKK